MNDIFAKRRARLLAMKAMRDNYVPGDKLVTCPKCGRESEKKAVAEGLSVCPLCGYHFPIGAYYRLSTVLDSGTFRELNAKLPAADPLAFPGYGPKLALAQVGAIAILSLPENKGKIALFGGVKNARFKRQVIPGDVLEMECVLTKRRGPVGIGECKATVNDETACTAELIFAVQAG